MVRREEKDFPGWVPSFLFHKKVCCKTYSGVNLPYFFMLPIAAEGDRMEAIKSSVEYSRFGSGMMEQLIQNGMGGHKGV